MGLASGFAMVGVARGFGDYLGRPLIRDGGGGLLRLAAVGVAVMTHGGLRGIAFGFMVGSLAGELGFIAYGCCADGFGATGSIAGTPISGGACVPTR